MVLNQDILPRSRKHSQSDETDIFLGSPGRDPGKCVIGGHGGTDSRRHTMPNEFGELTKELKRLQDGRPANHLRKAPPANCAPDAGAEYART
jgi:hypothetical protein